MLQWHCHVSNCNCHWCCLFAFVDYAINILILCDCVHINLNSSGFHLIGLNIVRLWASMSFLSLLKGRSITAQVDEVDADVVVVVVQGEEEVMLEMHTAMRQPHLLRIRVNSQPWVVASEIIVQNISPVPLFTFNFGFLFELVKTKTSFGNWILILWVRRIFI